MSRFLGGCDEVIGAREVKTIAELNGEGRDVNDLTSIFGRSIKSVGAESRTRSALRIEIEGKSGR